MHRFTKLALTTAASALAVLSIADAALAQAQEVGPTATTAAAPAAAPATVPAAAPAPAPAATQAPVAEPAVVQAPAVVPPPAPTPVAFTQPAPAAADAPPAVTFSGKLVAAAAAFETYTGRAATLKADFASGDQVADALRAGSAYELKQMQAGEIAFAAIVALQDPAFVQGARELARDPRAAEVLLGDPRTVAAIPGSEAAAARVGAALRERGAKVLAVGQAVKQSAYDIQHQPWSLVHVADPQKVLAQSKALSSMEFNPSADDTARLVKLASSAPSGGDASALAMPVVQRGLALAAMAVLGQAGDGSEGRISPLLAEDKGADCMRMAKLNLYQCLAVAGPQYEDVFCLGQHALMDTGQCVMASATPKASPMPRVMQVASRAPAPTGGAMLIPVAQVSTVAPQK